MRKRVKEITIKAVCLVTCLLLVLSSGIAEAFPFDYYDRGYVSLDVIHNRLIMAGADPVNGRFVIRTLEGDPNNNWDRRLDLLVPARLPASVGQWGAESSFTTVRVNGQDYIFGNNYSFLGLGNSVLANEIIDQGTHETVWQVQGLKATQTLEVPQDETDPKSGLVRISYAMQNTTSTAMEVGVRILLDLAAGTSHTPQVIMPGREGALRINFETEYSGTDIPESWQGLSTRYIMDRPFHRYTTGLLRGAGGRDPDRVVVGHWKSLSDHIWNYTPNPELNFMSADNTHQTGDTSMAIYWDTVTLQAGDTLHYETYYGVGMNLVSKNPFLPNEVLYPGIVKLTENEDAYADFDVHFFFKNNYSKTVESVTVIIDPKFFKVKETRLLRTTGMEHLGNRNILGLGNLNPGDGYTLSFTMAPMELLRQKEVKQLFLEVLYRDPDTGDVESESYHYNIVVPSIANWPTVTFTGITPDNPYFMGDTNFHIQGSGFNYLGNIGSNGDLQIVIEDIDDPNIRAEVPTNFMQVVSDNIIRFRFNFAQRIQRSYGTAVDTQYRVTISHRHRVIDSHTFEAIITASSLLRHINRDYGILAIYREYDGYEYKARVFMNERELDIFDRWSYVGGEKQYYPLIIIRGSVFGNEETGFQVGDGAMINDFVLYSAPKDEPDAKLFIHKYPEDGGHRFPYMRLDGRGTLTVGREEIIDDSFYLKLEDQKAYSLNWAKGDGNLWGDQTDYGDEFPGEVYDPLPVMIRRNNSEVVNLLSKLLGFLVSVEDIRLRSNGISLGGHLGFFLDAGLIPGIPSLGDSSGGQQSHNEAAKSQIGKKGQLGGGVYIDDIRYGPFGFEGIKARVTVAIPSQFIPVLNLGATGTLMIDTIEDVYGVDCKFHFQFVEAEGTLTIHLMDGNIPIPDTLNFEIASNPGLPVFPPTVLFNITRGGGGIGNISTIVAGGKAMPWVRFAAGIGTPVSATLSADPVEIYLSPTLSEIKGHLNIQGLKIADAKLQVLLGPKYGLRLVGEGGLNLLDAITGRAQLYIGYNNDPRNPLRPLELGGRAIVSGQVPILGIKLADAMAGISSQDIYVRGKILGGLVDVGAKYHFGDNRFYFASLDTGLTGTANSGEEYVCIETPDEKLVIDNFTLLASSRRGQAGPLQLAALDSGALEHEITISSTAQTLLRIIYSGSQPQVEIRQPDDSLFVLVEDENYQLGEGEAGEENSMWVLLDHPQTGIWQLSSDKPVDYELVEVSPLPEITRLNAYAGEDETVNVLLQTKQGKGLSLRLYLSKDTEDPGQLVGEYDLEEDNAQRTIELPSGLSAGDYYVRAELMHNGSNVHSVYSDEVFRVSNPYTPAAPVQVDLENAGGDLLKVSWDAPDDTAVGYHLELLDEHGQPLPDAGSAYLERQEGGRQEVLVSGRWQVSVDGQWVGLSDGQLCQVAVTAVNIVKEDAAGEVEAGETQEITYTSSSTVSNKVNFRTARYPQLTYTLENAGGSLLEQTVGGRKEYLSSAKEIIVSLAVDMQSRMVVLHEGELAEANEGAALDVKLTLREGSNELSFYAQNDTGDRTEQRVVVRVDTTPPVLMISSPEPGSVISGEQVEVVGFAEPGSLVTVNGEEAQTTTGGSFTTLVSMGLVQSKLIIVEAVDAAGNTSTYETRVQREAPGQIRSVRIGVEAEIIERDEPVTLQLYATYADGSEWVVDNRNFTWSLSAGGDEFVSISKEGELVVSEEGSVYVTASYPLTESFALQDIRLFSLGEVEKFVPVEEPAEPEEPPGSTDPVDPADPPDELPPPPPYSPVLAVARTYDDLFLNERLAVLGEASIDVGLRPNPVAEISDNVIGVLTQQNSVLRIIGRGAELSFPPKALPADSSSQRTTLLLGVREVTDAERQDILLTTPLGEASGLFEIGGKIFDLTAQLRRGQTTEPIQSFGAPVAVTIDLSHLGQLTEGQLSQLVGVRLEVDDAGNVVPVSLGGRYDPVKQTFTFHTERFSLYSVMRYTGAKPYEKMPLTLLLTINGHMATVNGKEIVLDVAPIAVQGRTMVPVRFVAETMGAAVDWIQETETVVIALDGFEIRLVVGEVDPTTGLDVPAQIMNGRTLVPLRYIAESLGATVEWYEESNTVEIVRK